MARSESDQVVTVGGRRLKLTNLDKVLYPATGTTKGDVLAYYAAVADVMIPHIANRPATRKRWVHGVGTPNHPGEMFFHKNLDDSTPDWVKRRELKHKERHTTYPLVNDLATLIWLAQSAALEIHVPQWQFGRTGQQRNPDRLVLDLDPGPGAGLRECAEVAKAVRSILTDMGLTALPVTSGSKGIHLYAALDGKQSVEQVSAVAHELARALEADLPDLVVSDMKKSIRNGKVLVDWSQNNGAKTTIAPYSLRGRFEPTVAAPRTWRELASASLRQLDYREVMRRVTAKGDPLAELTAGHLESLEPTADRLAGFEAERPDRLQKYRSMRSADKTPEPVPAAPAATSDGNSFVIQEHHARRLHYDFRLEHDGVLVSWALPKGVPTEPKQNHLAVQTEDHPLEYGSFEGTIPAGEYGAGTVSIWDSGTYDLEKWRDGEEVIVTLHGRRGGGLGEVRKVALIHTGGSHGDQSAKGEQNWLIHLMKDQAPHPTPHPRSSRAAVKTASTVAPAAMLATLGTAADIIEEPEESGQDVENWAFEMKWDGIRAIVTVADGKVSIASRNGHNVTAAYPELASLADAVAGRQATLDGEIVALDRSGRPDFGLLQGRMNLTKPAEIARAAQSIPVHIMLFDLLALDGRSMLTDAYDDRRTALEALVTTTATSTAQVPPAFPGDLQHAIETSKTLRLEGVVAKERRSTYLPGKRSRSWIKIKHHKTQEVIVVGWMEGAGRRANGIGSLLLAIPDGSGLRYAGKVGTGFSDRMLDEILGRLTGRARATPPVDGAPAAEARGAHWVRPDLVGEVDFAEWTADHRLRQPVWRGWRPDKDAADVRDENPS